MTTARTVALDVLLEIRKKEAFVQELLDDAFKKSDLAPPDRRLATQLVLGVVRRRASLDLLIRRVVTRESHKVEAWIWEALRLGTLQLAYLDRIPAYSAIHETVDLAIHRNAVRAKGFVNANLRAIDRLLTPDFVTDPGPAALPIETGRYRRLTEPVLPDPGTHPVDYLSVGLSLPEWLVTRWQRRWGTDETRRLGFWFLQPAPLWLRVNPLRTTREAFIGWLREAGLEPIVGEHPQAVRLEETLGVRDIPGFAEGYFVVQDLSAMKIATALQPRPGMTILDLCAAPGGKATHLAELIGEQGRVIACDRDARRLAPLTSTIERLGLTSIEPTPIGEGEPPPGPFDAVLVDVPCSNTGVLGRRPEARWRLTAGEIAQLGPLQARLLTAALARTKPGGTIVYSTCSIEPEENGDLVRRVIGDGCATIEAEEMSSPGMPADGGYWARLRKT
jgi:16S rRNA (cytosine967-C5)-methyltransferase